MGKLIESTRRIILNNKSVIENYFFMTLLQVLNSFFYLLIYPYLIRVLGSTGWGLYIFSTSIASYFMLFLNFGFDMPATKQIAENTSQPQQLTNTLSYIFTVKTLLFFLLSIVFAILVSTVPIFKENKLLFIWGFLSIYSVVIFPAWFFQGIQKMKVVTYIQLGLKVLSLPLIFLFVKHTEDLIIYAAIVSLTTLLGGGIAYLIIRVSYGLKIHWVHYNLLIPHFKEALPFFYTNIANNIKLNSIPVIIGFFFGMREVAIYDLANKVISAPRTIFMSVNAAIFPKLIVNLKSETVKKIIKIETLVSCATILLIILLGKYAIQILGGADMMDAYYLTVLLSITIISWLVVGAYIYFVFIPNNRNYYITINQLVATGSFFALSIGGLLIYPDIMIFGLAMSLSGVIEVLYCLYITKKEKLL